MNERILIIGANKSQIPIIKTAKRLGCYVIVASDRPDAPGISIADNWLKTDVLSGDQVIKDVQGLQIDGVISDLSDELILTTAYVADALNLPGCGYENAVCFTNKAKMRELCKKLNIGTPSYKCVENYVSALAAAQDIGFPVVVKPSDSFASRGVTLVREKAELEKAFNLAADFSTSRSVVIEKYISGTQYFSQGFVAAGTLRLFAYSDRYYHKLENLFIPYTNAFPAQIDGTLKDEMNSILQKIVEYLHPSFGHVWAEWILDQATNELYIAELAIRGAGTYVTSHVIPCAYEVDTQEYLVRAALGKDVSDFHKLDLTNKRASAFVSFLLPEGKISAIKGLDIVGRIPGILCEDIKSIQIGDLVPPIQNKGSRYGVIAVAGKDRCEINSIHQKLMDTMVITVKTSNGMKNIIWT